MAEIVAQQTNAQRQQAVYDACKESPVFEIDGREVELRRLRCCPATKCLRAEIYVDGRALVDAVGDNDWRWPNPPTHAAIDTQEVATPERLRRRLGNTIRVARFARDPKRALEASVAILVRRFRGD